MDSRAFRNITLSLAGGESQKEVIRPDFYPAIMVDFQGAPSTSSQKLEPLNITDKNQAWCYQRVVLFLTQPVLAFFW